MAASPSSSSLTSQHDEIVILDFGSQYSHLIARRVRALHVFCELFNGTSSAPEILVGKDVERVKGVIFSGGPSSVYEEDAPHVHESVWTWIAERKLPVLGICYGMQEIAAHFGGEVAASKEREFGKSSLILTCFDSIEGIGAGEKRERETVQQNLFSGLSDTAGKGHQMWMSHGDKVTRLPEGFVSIASSENSENAAIAHINGLFYGLQFHPEVSHSLQGERILSNFVLSLCSASPSWDMRVLADDLIQSLRDRVGERDHVIGAVSGGVDSSVAAVLLQKAIGSRFHAVLVDNGLLRLNEAVKVSGRLRDHLGVNLTVIDAGDRFLSALAGVTDPEKKRKAIGGLFIDVFQEQARAIESERERVSDGGRVSHLLQGTLYPDVIESLSHRGPSATIKTHHNVGGLPAHLSLSLIEPLRELFKDEVRELGVALGIPRESLMRHPFPGPGLGIRVLGEVTRERVEVLRHADDIVIQELEAAGIYDDIAQVSSDNM